MDPTSTAYKHAAKTDRLKTFRKLTGYAKRSPFQMQMPMFCQAHANTVGTISMKPVSILAAHRIVNWPQVKSFQFYHFLWVSSREFFLTTVTPGVVMGPWAQNLILWSVLTHWSLVEKRPQNKLSRIKSKAKTSSTIKRLKYAWLLWLMASRRNSLFWQHYSNYPNRPDKQELEPYIFLC